MGMATICFAPVFGFVWMAWILMGPPPPAPKKYVKSSLYEWWYKTKFQQILTFLDTKHLKMNPNDNRKSWGDFKYLEYK